MHCERLAVPGVRKVVEIRAHTVRHPEVQTQGIPDELDIRTAK